MILLLMSLIGCGNQTAADLEQPASPPEPHVLERESSSATLPVQGTVRVVTIKNETAQVPGRFDGVTGEVTLSDVDTWQGISGQITVDLASWSSDNELRDQRVRDTFFHVVDYPTAELSLSGITGLASGGIKVGQSSAAGVRGKIKLHGISKDVAIPVMIQRAGKEAFVITTPEPFELKISDYQFSESLDALIKECGHKSVGDVVEVSVELSLGQLTELPADKLPAADGADGAGAGEAPPAEVPLPGAAGKKAGGKATQ